ncbi:unnamed protein product [Bursaphelenchus okinawaensis]|uniref:Schwannomin interacting protein 1 C-terminal domain-containing protein n=1 Tax=Bursaphelenchus okinawaensis TaxID=465554 RepID=A0A811LRA6_9BILA|nr:unnamed protein product [Bursaphelenchus okinawaensis]CAG9128086.1 unnamed protein product [Bursaphelenchus okinawaensis]
MRSIYRAQQPSTSHSLTSSASSTSTSASSLQSLDYSNNNALINQLSSRLQDTVLSRLQDPTLGRLQDTAISPLNSLNNISTVRRNPFSTEATIQYDLLDNTPYVQYDQTDVYRDFAVEQHKFGNEIRHRQLTVSRLQPGFEDDEELPYLRRHDQGNLYYKDDTSSTLHRLSGVDASSTVHRLSRVDASSTINHASETENDDKYNTETDEMLKIAQSDDGPWLRYKRTDVTHKPTPSHNEERQRLNQQESCRNLQYNPIHTGCLLHKSDEDDDINNGINDDCNLNFDRTLYGFNCHKAQHDFSIHKSSCGQGNTGFGAKVQRKLQNDKPKIRTVRYNPAAAAYGGPSNRYGLDKGPNDCNGISNTSICMHDHTKAMNNITSHTSALNNINSQNSSFNSINSPPNISKRLHSSRKTSICTNNININIGNCSVRPSTSINLSNVRPLTSVNLSLVRPSTSVSFSTVRPSTSTNFRPPSSNFYKTYDFTSNTLVTADGSKSEFTTEQIYKKIGRKRFLRKELSKTPVAKLREIMEELEARVDVANTDLVLLLMKRDQVYLEKDALQLEVEDIVEFHKAQNVVLTQNHVVQGRCN